LVDPAISGGNGWAVYSPAVSASTVTSGSSQLIASGSSGGSGSGGGLGGSGSGGIGGSGYSDTILVDGPVAYWRLGESGVAADLVGSNTGSLVGGVTTGVTGALGGDSNTAMSFN